MFINSLTEWEKRQLYYDLLGALDNLGTVLADHGIETDALETVEELIDQLVGEECQA